MVLAISVRVRGFRNNSGKLRSRTNWVVKTMLQGGIGSGVREYLAVSIAAVSNAKSLLTKIR